LKNRPLIPSRVKNIFEGKRKRGKLKEKGRETKGK
jgi:hypothetical protein